MGSRLMHYCIAHMVRAEMLRDPERGSRGGGSVRTAVSSEGFVVGNLAPDAHEPTWAGKVSSHFLLPPDAPGFDFVDLAELRASYLAQPQAPEDAAFTLGCFCHLLVDNEWYKVIFRRYIRCSFRESYANLVVSQANDASAVRGRLYPDYERLNGLLIERFALIHPRAGLSAPIAPCVRGVDPDGLSALARDLDRDFASGDTSPMTLLEPEIAIAFVSDMARRCAAVVRELPSRWPLGNAAM